MHMTKGIMRRLRRLRRLTNCRFPDLTVGEDVKSFVIGL
jgi:hypothetical protein